MLCLARRISRGTIGIGAVRPFRAADDIIILPGHVVERIRRQNSKTCRTCVIINDYTRSGKTEWKMIDLSDVYRATVYTKIINNEKKKIKVNNCILQMFPLNILTGKDTFFFFFLISSESKIIFLNFKTRNF